MKTTCWQYLLAVYGLWGIWLMPASALHGQDSGIDLRIVSYNIKHGQGNDGKVDLERTAQTLAELQADIIGLQEVDEKASRSGSINQAAELGKRLGMQHAFGAFMDLQGGRYGLALLSRLPIAKTETVELPEGNEPRVALAAQIALNARQSINVVNLHFDWVRDDRFRFAQAQKLRAYLDGLKSPYVLLGDFNDQPGSRTLQLFQDGAVEARKPAQDRFTFSSTEPRSEIDFIFVAPAASWTVRQVRVIDEPLTSDHRPVLAEVAFRSAP